MQPQPKFAHQRLDAYRVSLELARLADGVATSLASRHRRIADQLQRASLAVPLLIAEGANRRTTGQKRQRFTEARGEAAEVAAAAELAAYIGLLSQEQAMEIETLCDRVVAMLTRLVARHAG